MTTTATLDNRIAELSTRLAGWIPSDIVRDNMTIGLRHLLAERAALTTRHDTFAAQRPISDDTMAHEFQGRCSCGETGTWSRSVGAAHSWRTNHEAATVPAVGR